MIRSAPSSGWPGRLPAGWQCKRLKYATRLINEKADGLLDGRPYVGLENVEPETGRLVQMDGDLEPEGVSNLFEPGDVLFGKLRPYLAKALAADFPGRCTSELLVVRPESAEPRFLHYYMLSDGFVRLVDSSTYGAKMPRASWDFIGNMPLALPPTVQQCAIAAFLDRKTKAIADLIAKKECLIDLLDEKRQAVVTRAVTKGLDYNVPMQDSGVEWLGEIPAHWEVRRLKRISPKLQGRLVVQPHLYFSDSGVPIVFGYNIRGGRIVEDGLSLISHQADLRHKHAKVRAGDVLTVRLGDPGMTAVVPPTLDGCHFASIMWIHQHPRFNSHWLAHAMNSTVVQRQITAVNYGAAQTQFNISDAVNFILPFPPYREQRRIADFLSDAIERIDNAKAKLRRQLEVIREYRLALVTAAVTGKLDVQSEVAG